MSSLILPCVVALIGSAGLTVAVRRLAVRCGAMDHPDGQRKLHAESTPLWGGIGVFAALAIGLATAIPAISAAGSDGLSLATLMLLAAGGLCLLGVVDDCHVVKSRQKLFLQVVVLTLLVGAGYQFDRVSLLGHAVALGWLAPIITMVWLLGCINAFNLLDGSDGLAASVGLAASLLIAVVAMAGGHGDVAIMAGVLAGATAGFLLHNRPTARIFLGDSGSMVIGLVVGILSVEAARTPRGEVVIVFPAVLMCIPLFDSLLALVRRKLSGRPFDAPDREHIHHRLMQRGMSPWRVLAVITGLFTLTGIAAAAAVLFGQRAIGWTAAVTLVAWLVRSRWFGHHEWELSARAVGRGYRRLGNYFGTAVARPTERDETSQDHSSTEKKTSQRRAA